MRLPEKAASQIAGFNLDVQARDYDLQDLGLNLPGNVALAGQADFTGKVTGTPDAPNAVGNLGLQNLRVNDLAFEPILTGRLNGTLSGKISVNGSLPPGRQPAFKVSFDLFGQDWVLGNYTRIDEVVAQGTYDNGVLTLLPLRVDLGEGLIALTGRLAQEQLSGQVRVESLPVSLIEPFLPPQLPVQVAGNLNALVTLAGSLESPTAIGEVALGDFQKIGYQLSWSDEDVPFWQKRISF